MNELQKLIERRTAKASEARHILEGARLATRDLNAEERGKYDALMTEIDGLNGDIVRLQKMQILDASLGAPTREANLPDAGIGMSTKEIGQYSLVRALRAAAESRTNPRAWDEAGLEREASDAVAKQTGKQARSFFIPMDWASKSLQEARGLSDAVMHDVVKRLGRLEKRDLTAGTNNAGGYTVQTDLLGDSFIELLRNQMVLRRAGATVLGGLVGNIAIPSQSGGATAYWVAENAAPTESQQTIGQVTMSPKTVGAYTDISRRLLAQSSIDVEAFVRNDLAQVLAIAIDYAGLHDSGASNHPTGVASVSGIGAVYAGDAASNGTNANGIAPVWADVVNLETSVAVSNANIGALAYITNPKVRGKFKKTQIASNLPMIWQGAELNGYPTFVSSQVRSDITKGSSTTLSAMFFGNWADLIIGMWGAIDVLVDPYTGGTAGTVRVVELQDIDIAARHAASFAMCADMLAG